MEYHPKPHGFTHSDSISPTCTTCTLCRSDY